MTNETLLFNGRRLAMQAWILPMHLWRVFRRWPVLPVALLALLIVAAIFSPLIAPKDPIRGILKHRNAAPIWNTQWYEEHPRVDYRYVLGADLMGRDVLSRVIHGARVSLIVVTVATTSSLILGTTLGLLSGYFGGPVDELTMRVVDLWLGLPYVLIALVVVIIFGQSFTVLVALLALLAWPAFVRNVRAEALSLRTRDYVALAKIAGASSWHIVLRHILPGVLNTIIVLATLRVGQLIMMEAILSFLGAGIPPPTPAWGLMVAEGRDYIGDAWWTSFFPGVAIFLVVMSLNFLGDWLRDYADPRLRQLR